MTLKNQLQDILSNQKNPEILEKILEDAWLNIYVDEEKLYNPLLDIPDFMENKEELYITYLMSRPEYLSFFCKEILNIQLMPYQSLILSEIWNRKFPMLVATRGAGKSFLLSLYCLLRMIFLPRRKVVVCGAAFRQSKVLFDYMCSIWDNAPLLRTMVGEGGGNGPRKETDMYSFIIGQSITKALPIGDGSKIRGQRANDIISDEFSSLPKEVFENVIAGFASVRAAPVDMVKQVAKDYLIKKYNIPTVQNEKDTEFSKDNQIVISGTAYYDFNHFADYWKKWHKIISSCGDKEVLSQIFDSENEEDFENFDWTQYSIIRIPYNLLPKGYMDDDQIARSRATVHSGIFQMEFSAIFANDSNGFFKRSLIESCVVSEKNPIDFGDGPILFESAIRGNPQCKYVFGIDTASERDNFAIVILELHQNHRRIVYCWTTNRKDHREKLKTGLVEEKDFYSYCVRKIRDLMRLFPCERMAIDSQGGGLAIIEGLHDKDKKLDDEHLIWPTRDEDPKKWKDEDNQPGLHIIDIVNFASADWCAEANNGLRKDFEDKICLFPMFDTVTLSLSFEEDQQNDRRFDTLEDCVLDIEELKNELSMIMMSRTASGRDRWDTPEIKLPGGKKDRLKKDRYSALIMANTSARRLTRVLPNIDYTGHGGFVHELNKKDGKELGFIGPDWFVEQMGDVYNAYG